MLERFAADGIDAAATPFAPIGVRLADKPALQHHPLFLEGKVEVQDEASQLLTWLVAPRRREMVVDFCAGAGGKTLALGAAMRSEGRLYAFDTSKARLANLAPRLKRSGLSNVHPQHIDSEHDRRIKRLAGKIDRVLGRRALQRPGHAAPQSGPQVASVAGRPRGARGQAERHPRRGRSPGKARRSARLRHLQHPARGERRGGGAHSWRRIRSFARFTAANCWRARASALDTGEHLLVSPHAHGMDGFFAAAWNAAGTPS